MWRTNTSNVSPGGWGSHVTHVMQHGFLCKGDF